MSPTTSLGTPARGPAHLTDRIVEEPERNAVDDDLAEFVYNYALFVQREANVAWEQCVSEAQLKR